MSIHNLAIPVTADVVVVEITVGCSLNRHICSAASIKKENSDGPVIRDKVFYYLGVIRLVTKDHTGSVKVDVVVMDVVSIAVVDVDTGSVPGDLTIADFSKITLALYGDTG